MNWFLSLDSLHQIFWVVALLGSLFFLVQTIMTFTGTDAGDGLSADFDGGLDGGDAPFQLFSLRNLVNFLMGFGWTGVSFYESISSRPLLIAVSIAVGLAFVWLFFIIIRQIQKLAEDNSFNIQKIVGKTAEVYIPIPAHQAGKGKVQVSAQGAFHELDAITQGDRIESGKLVKILSVGTGNLLLVEPL